LLIEAGHECWDDGYVVEEARRNLAARAAGGLSALEGHLARVNVAGVQLLGNLPVAALRLPEKDRPVLAAAMRPGCAALATGDRSRFGAVYGKTLGGVTIHSARSLAEALLL
jgi:hypothetical protein